MQNDDVRLQLIRQFPAEVVEASSMREGTYYACPTCGRPVALGMDKCIGCNQVLSWKNINQCRKMGGERLFWSLKFLRILLMVTVGNVQCLILEKANREVFMSVR